MSKEERTLELYDDQFEWLQEAASKHDLPDVDKALRVVLDYVMDEGDDQTIFQEIRCRHC